MSRSERRSRSETVLKRRRKLWISRVYFFKDPLTGEVITPIEKFTFLKTTVKPCSCYVCGNPRKHFKHRTVQEKKFDLRFNEEIKEEKIKDVA